MRAADGDARVHIRHPVGARAEREAPRPRKHPQRLLGPRAGDGGVDHDLLVAVAEVAAIRATAGTGAIVNNSSLGSLRGNPEPPACGAMKRAVNSLTESAAVTYGPEGIRVNAIASGNTLTEILRAWEAESPGLQDRLTALAPLRRAAVPEEIAEAAAWLLSDRSSFVTGTVLRVGGGARA